MDCGLRALRIDVAYGWLADFLNLIESLASRGEKAWPDAVLRGLLPLIPKEEGATEPIEQRPLTLLAVVYRLWAVLRLRDIGDWRRAWLDPSAYGGAPGRGADDGWY